MCLAEVCLRVFHLAFLHIFGLNDKVVWFCFNSFTSNCGICYAD